MKAIHKYPFEVHVGSRSEGYDEIVIEMPMGSDILCVQVQRGTPCIWALVDVDIDRETISRRFAIWGNGHKHEQKVEKYVGTFQLHRETFAGHLFEIT